MKLALYTYNLSRNKLCKQDKLQATWELYHKPHYPHFFFKISRNGCGEKPDLLTLNSDVLERTQIETGPTDGEVSVYFIYDLVHKTQIEARRGKRIGTS